MKAHITSKGELYRTVPANVAMEAMETLEAYNTVYITREYGKYRVTAGLVIKSTYAPDSKVYVVNASDVYTDKERNLNYMNTFHEFPHGFRGNNDDRRILLSPFMDAHKVVDYDDNGTLYYA